jgi:uncharacterized protein
MAQFSRGKSGILMFKPVEFPSEGATLRGRYYAQLSPQAPTLVMAHGTSATIPMVADAYAEAFHRAGLNVLLYDHRNFGISGGEPRYEINPWVQARGYRDAVDFLRGRAGSGPIAIWGDSYSAMLVLVVGALIDDLVAIVVQIPACGTELPGVAPSAATLATMRAVLQEGDVSGGPEHTTGPLPVVSADQINAPSLLKPIQAYRWFIEYGGRFDSLWENRVTRVVPATLVPFNAYLTAPYLKAPTFMMVGRNDEMIHCRRSIQQAVFDKIAGPKKFYEIDGGHFGLLWHPGRLFDEAATRQTAFLKETLKL